MHEDRLDALCLFSLEKKKTEARFIKSLHMQKKLKKKVLQTRWKSVILNIEMGQFQYSNGLKLQEGRFRLEIYEEFSNYDIRVL